MKSKKNKQKKTLVDFNVLPESSRVWTYQANRTFTDEELEEIKEKLNVFIENWTAHGSDLHFTKLSSIQKDQLPRLVNAQNQS